MRRENAQVYDEPRSAKLVKDSLDKPYNILAVYIAVHR